jgi:F-type H+-transporting ATPase subunit gamma
MKLVSAAKLKKAQEAVTNSRAYTESLYGLLSLLRAEGAGEGLSHPLLEERQVSRILLFIIGGARGLAGGYNSNVNKKVEAFFQEKKLQAPHVEIDSIVMGKKAGEFFRRTKKKYLESHEELPEDVFQWPLDSVCAGIEERFSNNEYDEVYIIYTKFRSAISVTPRVERLLPLSALQLGTTAQPRPDHAKSDQTERTHEKLSSNTNILFEPGQQAVFAAVVPRILRSIVRQAAFDAKASEHGSRMSAMDTATKNAGELNEKLTLTYNKLRQSGITGELLDIIGGAGAVE